MNLPRIDRDRFLTGRSPRYSSAGRSTGNVVRRRGPAGGHFGFGNRRWVPPVFHPATCAAEISHATKPTLLRRRASGTPAATGTAPGHTDPSDDTAATRAASTLKGTLGNRAERARGVVGARTHQGPAPSALAPGVSRRTGVRLKRSFRADDGPEATRLRERVASGVASEARARVDSAARRGVGRDGASKRVGGGGGSPRGGDREALDAAEDRAADAPALFSQRGGAQAKLHVLLVEDDQATMVFVKALLKSCGHKGARAPSFRRRRALATRARRRTTSAVVTRDSLATTTSAPKDANANSANRTRSHGPAGSPSPRL